MRIAILHPSSEGSSAPFKDLDPDCDPARFLPDHDCEQYRIAKATAVRDVTAILRRDFDVVINLCDGARDEDRAGIEVVETLERHNVAFTGAGKSFYEPSREAMKIACHSVGVSFPAYALVRDEAEAEREAVMLRFPMIVKHPNSYSSIGMTRDSRVTDVEALRREVARTTRAYGAALIEEFIEGREFTVLVAEARDAAEEAWALEPVEFVFPSGESFKHFDLKWKDHAQMETTRVADAALSARLREAAGLTFAALGGSSYGRCDIRVDAAGEVFVLEINPNCGVFYPEGQFGSADFVLANDPAGHRGFLDHLIRCARRRSDLGVRAWVLRYGKRSGFGMFAARALREGEVVERFEERPHVLASRRHVERHWKGRKREWFERYAWPLSSGVYALWSDDPDQWRPLNHSCDPNTWLEGLDLVARRPLQRGEEITADYATFCGPGMAPFACACGAATCRRVIQATDLLLAEVRERYGSHVSDYVRATWADTSPDSGPPYEVVWSPLGLGVVARRAWRAGDVVARCALTDRQADASRWTLQIAPSEHVVPSPPELRYINHSCAPNIAFDVGDGAIRSLADIRPGDELRLFYPATEWYMAEGFECRCGAVDCLGQIAGASRISRETSKRYALAPFIREMLDASRC